MKCIFNYIIFYFNLIKFFFRNNLKNKKKTIEEPKEEKKVEEKFIEKKEIESNKDKEPSLKESEYSESFKELQKELLDDSKE